LSTHTCVGDTPLNWSGPIALYEGTAAAPACPGAFPTKLNDLHSDLSPGTASCDCTCSPASGITGCTGEAKIYDFPEGATGCFVAPGPGTPLVFSGAPGQCLPTNILNGGNYDMEPPSPSSSGSCAANSNHTLPTPQWATAARTCSGGSATGADCGSGKQCIPRAQDPYKLCVYQPGDVACPSALYSEKHLAYEGFADTRACSTCSCGAAQSTCGGTVTLFSTATCGTSAAGSIGAGCKSLSAFANPPLGRYTANPSGTCAPSSSTLSGEVTTNGATTFCCATN
jgi:hypothetical protein